MNLENAFLIQRIYIDGSTLKRERDKGHKLLTGHNAELIRGPSGVWILQVKGKTVAKLDFTKV